MKIYIYTLFLLTLFTSPELQASLDFSATMNGTDATNSYVSDPGADWAESISMYSSQDVQDFQVDFSLIDEETVLLSINAPEGYKFSVDAPAGWDLVLFEVGTDWGNQLSYTATLGDSDVQYAFQNFSGDPITAWQSELWLSETPTAGTGGENINLKSSFSFTGGESFSFSGVTLTATVPDGWDYNYEGSMGETFLKGVSQNYTEDAALPPDPGQWVSLVAIPEPSTALIFLSMLPVLYIFQRRIRLEN